MSSQTERIIETCVYVISKDEEPNKVLLVKRSKEPNKSLWVPLGGEVGFDESPYGCALRELKRSGLKARRVLFRGLITEISPIENKQWLLFIYVVTDFDGEIVNNFDDGQLDWVSLETLSSLPKPQSDNVFGPMVLDLKAPFYDTTMYFDDNKKLTRIEKAIF